MRRTRRGSHEAVTLSKRKVWNKAMAIERVRQVVGTGTPLDLAAFDKKELLLGKILGRGSFSVVEEITSICFLANSSSFTSQHRKELRLKEEERNFLAQHCLRSSGHGRPSPRYALKRLQTNGDWNGVADLVIESHFLRRLQHPNLIKIRAVAVGDTFHLDFFLVLDRLYCTLQTKLRQWKRDERNWWNCRRTSNMGERLIAAYHLGSALQYLHEQRICHRDIKPENCGFDIRGDIKIFDLGLAREMRNPNADGTYNLSHMTGTLRFMAPEVFQEGKSYNELCDVYSFAILLWQMIVLEQPFRHMNDEQTFVKIVFEKHGRPDLTKVHPPRCQALLKKAWHAVPSERPSMSEVCSDLRRMTMEIEFGESGDFETASRRSTFIYDETESGYIMENLSDGSSKKSANK
ncbi:hypothetical protein FisN_1Hh053 [Fistulifera solaris]|uniref:Protein kinase domain-containing protein n=1 Tax=Fistulifera solaris TaxID=1519565 RepID=A0A1Z5JEB7_FISSO|nr:hypothetical protein FisN_1Hh053 [Fistulifera solaris]|eukprot:GAX12128.1 hypothetical protein FisN_1Hh053 [Fistulifera solaris]